MNQHVYDKFRNNSDPILKEKSLQLEKKRRKVDFLLNFGRFFACLRLDLSKYHGW